MRKTTTREEWALVSKKFLLGVEYIRLGKQLEEHRDARELLYIAMAIKEQEEKPKLERINSLDEGSSQSQSQSSQQ